MECLDEEICSETKRKKALEGLDYEYIEFPDTINQTIRKDKKYILSKEKDAVLLIKK